MNRTHILLRSWPYVSIALPSTHLLSTPALGWRRLRTFMLHTMRTEEISNYACGIPTSVTVRDMSEQ